MPDDPEKQVSLDDFIKITEAMDMADYHNFMKLPMEQRTQIALKILKEESRIVPIEIHYKELLAISYLLGLFKDMGIIGGIVDSVGRDPEKRKAFLDVLESLQKFVDVQDEKFLKTNFHSFAINIYSDLKADLIVLNLMAAVWHSKIKDERPAMELKKLVKSQGILSSFIEK